MRVSAYVTPKSTVEYEAGLFLEINTVVTVCLLIVVGLYICLYKTQGWAPCRENHTVTKTKRKTRKYAKCGRRYYYYYYYYYIYLFKIISCYLFI
jgi:hypothetical protein